ncbi:hypothetical protein MXF13_02070 [Leclercia adecarboxylata]|uniref:hypothetical protein n=1 Tax=Leclercia adecarboxylata TaxID=83655 RepID=UPI002DBE0C67|nr:hypothetical protein [Leclercia adecarboxylata]MEB5748675.1 hypothetical protein [Leclercia adecarboxylata]
MLEMYRQHKTTADIFMLVILGVTVRVFYWGGKLRECCGDVLIGTIIMTFAAARLPSFEITIPELGALHFSHNEVAFIVGMLGYKGIKAVIFWVLKARFGIDLRERIAQRKNTSN